MGGVSLEPGHVTPGAGCGRGQPRDYGRVTPGAGSGRGQPGDCGRVTPGAGSADCVGLTPSTWVWILYRETPICALYLSVSILL